MRVRFFSLLLALQHCDHGSAAPFSISRVPRLDAHRIGSHFRVLYSPVVLGANQFAIEDTLDCQGRSGLLFRRTWGTIPWPVCHLATTQTLPPDAVASCELGSHAAWGIQSQSVAMMRVKVPLFCWAKVSSRTPQSRGWMENLGVG